MVSAKRVWSEVENLSGPVRSYRQQPDGRSSHHQRYQHGVLDLLPGDELAQRRGNGQCLHVLRIARVSACLKTWLK